MTTPEQTEQSHLQRAITAALARLPRARDFYDRQIQERQGVKSKPIYDIQRGKNRNPGGKLLADIADVLDVPLHELTGSRPPAPSAPPQADNVATLRKIDLALSMGDGTNLDDYIEEGTVEFDLDWLRSFTRAPPDRVVLGRGTGDSMFPTLLDSDWAVIDTTQTVLNQQDRIWAVSVHGAGGIKRLRKIGARLVEVMSDNATVGNREVDAEDVRIIGRVVGLARKL